MSILKKTKIHDSQRADFGGASDYGRDDPRREIEKLDISQSREEQNAQ